MSISNWKKKKTSDYPVKMAQWIYASAHPVCSKRTVMTNKIEKRKKNIHTNIYTHTYSDRKESKVLYHCSEKRLILTERIKEGFRRQDTWKASWRKKDLEGSEYGQVWIEKDLEEKEEHHGNVQEACKLLSGLAGDDVHLKMRFKKKSRARDKNILYMWNKIFFYDILLAMRAETADEGSKLLHLRTYEECSSRFWCWSLWWRLRDQLEGNEIVPTWEDESLV